MSNGGFANVPIGMTDPPSVPAGTRAVILTYSDVQVRTTGSSGWVTATGSGTANVLALVNASQTIADVQLSVNSTINAVRMNITSVKITINGTTYNATAPKTIMANITGNDTVKPNGAVLAAFLTNVTVKSNSTTHANTYAWSSSSSRAALTTNATVSVTIGTIVGIASSLRVGLGLNLGA